MHLFILSGQSNMARMNPKASFTPAVEQAFGKQNVIIVKNAKGSSPIRMWYKDWKPSPGGKTGYSGREKGYLYDALMNGVQRRIEGKKIQSVTFIWMQGEHDSGEKNASVYKDSLLGLIKQLSRDMKRDDINYVIGRLSQYKKGDTQWEGVRKAQVAAANASPRGSWVDTDDIDIDGIHYTNAGYKELGKQFAEQAIALIKKHSVTPNRKKED